MLLIDFFDRAVRHYPDREAFVKDKRIVTYQQAQQRTEKIAQLIHGLSGDRELKVGVLSANDIAAFECVLGCIRAGAVWVPLNARNSMDALAYFMDLTDCEILFIHSEFIPHVSQFQEKVPGLRHIICIDKEESGFAALESELENVSDALPPASSESNQVCSVFSTGGTTGHPKAAVWSHQTWQIFITNFLTAFHYEKPPVYLVVAPMTHAAGVVAFPLMALGATTVIMDQTDPLLIMQNIEKYGVTTLFLPPTAIYNMLAHPRVKEFDYSSLENFLYCAAPMSVEKLKEAIEVFGPVMMQSYGQAEAPMVITTFSKEEHMDALAKNKLERLASCGRPGLLSEVAILNDEGEMLPNNETGEIAVKGDLVMQGYYKNPEATSNARHGNWHRTGDVGHRDEDGFFYITDRRHDMIISGGFNIYPSEPEQILWSHQAVQDCAVIGVPDEKWGEAVAAVVQLKQGEAVREEELIALCKDKLGSIKSPKQIHFWDELPRSAVGKVLKREIRDHFWKDKQRKI